MKTHFFIIAFLLCIVGVQAQKPILQWSFNDIGSDSIFGNTVYTEGVAGKALVFDGYTSQINHKTNHQNLLKQNFTISAWVAPQEYSWNLSAIVNQQIDLSTGFFFGINHVGKLVGSLSVGTEWKTCISTDSLPLLLWSHVAMIFDVENGISLYINNKKVGETKFTGVPVFAVDVDIVLGKTQTKLTPAFTERNTSKAINSWMLFDGLMDEVQIYDKALTANDIAKLYDSFKVAVIQPLQYRRMPSGTNEDRPFGAYYTNLKFSPGWDNLWRGSDLPDIVVRFTNSPVKLVFWRGTGYIPAMVTENGIWMTDQSVENFGTGECYEAMGDKQCRYSHVRIIENTQARVVVHWRYALAGIKHQIYNETDTRTGEWVDEFWTAYPDGVVVRKQVLWSDFLPIKDQKFYQFQETIFFNQPGTKPQDNVDYEAITFSDSEGHKASYSWENGAPAKFDTPQYKTIQIVNTKSKYKPYGIYYPNRITFPFNFGWVKDYSTFPCWNHWPISQVASDGRNTVAPDKVSHTSLTQVNCDYQLFEKCPDNSVRVRSIMGMTTQPIDSLLHLARSWNFPAEIKLNSLNFKMNGYDQYQRCYTFENTTNTKQVLEFDVLGTNKSPIVNLACVIKNWRSSTATIEINGKKAIQGIDYTLGFLSALDSDDLVVWINMKSFSVVKVKII
jgi:hypothetical protein